MNPLERFAGMEEALRQALRAERATIWTTMPGIIVSFDEDKVTAVVQCALQGVVTKADGSAEAITLVPFQDVVVLFPRGGGVTLTFPIQPGDECVMHFASRCIDGWWQSGGVQLPMDTRMHDLSDAFCTVGPQSQVKKISGISTTTAQLRTDDGEAYIELNPADHSVNVVTSGDVTVNAEGDVDAVVGGDVTVNVDGDLDATVGGDASTTVGGDIDVVAIGHANTQAGSAQVTASTIRLVGAVTVVGTLNVVGLATLAGGLSAPPGAAGAGATIGVPLTVTASTTLADLTATSSVVGGKDNGPGHHHSNGNGGGPTGGII